MNNWSGGTLCIWEANKNPATTRMLSQQDRQITSVFLRVSHYRLLGRGVNPA